MQATAVLFFVLYFSFCTSSPACPQGTVRNRNNTCVLRGRCRSCPEGEHWEKCGTACPKTCITPNPKMCTLQCVSGCFCNEGTIRDTTTNTCVRLEDCTCPPNEMFTLCGSACDATCAVPNPVCTKQCVIGCSCPEGYVRDECNNYKCMPQEECPCKE